LELPKKVDLLTLEEKVLGGTKIPALTFDMSRIKEAEARLWEIQRMVPQTYKELDYTVQCCFRDSKNAVLQINGRILTLNSVLNRLKSLHVYEHKAKCIEEKMPKANITSTILIEAYLETCTEYVEVREEIGKMKLLSDWFENKTKVMDKASSMMKQVMYLYGKAGNFDLTT